MKRLMTYAILSLTLSVVTSAAMDDGELNITNIDWNTLKVDSFPPVYMEVVPLETDYTAHDYRVELEYPEYVALTPSEARMAERYDSLIGESIEPEAFVGVERKRGLLDISFIPLIKRDGKYMKLASAQISIKHTPKPRRTETRASADERYAAHSVLKDGRWVKISITQNGMYRLTRKALKNMGFSNPQNVHLYGYGGHQQKELITVGSHYDDLEEVPLYYSSGTDSWLFWGNGLVYWDGDTRVRNAFATSACYFLREENSPSAIGTIDSYDGTATKSFDYYREHILHESEEYAWYHAGRTLVEEYNFKNGSKTFNLSTPNPACDSIDLTIVFTANFPLETRMTPSVNGTTLPGITIPKSETSSYTYAASSKKTYVVRNNGAATTEWTVRIPQTPGVDSRLDYIAINYYRRLQPNNGQVSFTSPYTMPCQFEISGTGLVVMRTGMPGDPAVVVNGSQLSGKYVVKVEDPTRQYVAFDPNHAFPEPTIVGDVPNQNLHATDSLDMVIIIPANNKLLAEAKRLAEAHVRYDSLRVGIVNASQLYNEFSSGTRDATAYRKFMKMLYDRAESIDCAPKYLLLMGDCAWDNRMASSQWRSKSPDDYLLCYPSEESFSDTKSYCMEDYFGLMDDGEGGNLLRDKSDLGIGRFPVTNATDAKTMVDKSIAYISKENAGQWKNLVYFMGDDGDENGHMKYANEVAEKVKSNNPEMEVHKIMWDTFTRVGSAKSNTYPEATALIKKLMDSGAMVMNYTGHSYAYGLSHEYVILLEDFKQAKGTRLPLWVTCSCDAMPFDGQTENMGEGAVLNPNGGAVAFYGTARTVYASQNMYMNTYFMQYLFGKSNGRRNRLGDAIRLAKSSIISSGKEAGYKENKLQYALLGDPALVIGAPEYRVRLDSIDGTKVTNYAYTRLKAGQKVRISGHVEDGSGKEAASYNGIVSARLFDSEEDIVCKNNDGATVPFEFTDRQNLLYDSQDSVSDGRFEMEFVIPIDINYSDKTGRFVFYAIDNGHTTEANGYSERITLGGIAEDLGYDQEGPDIFAYLNDEGFKDGDVVNSTPYFVARIADESGVNSSGNGIGHDLTLCVDGRADMTYVVNDYYVRDFGDFTKGTLAYTIPRLEEGPHSATIRAWDVLNHTNTRTINFVVDPAIKPSILRLTASNNPATESTTFLVSYDMPGSECTFTIEVFNFMGRLVWSKTETASSEQSLYSLPWNLTNGNGAKLGSGLYLYRCTMHSGESKKVSETQKLIILNNK